ncbi:hypothetical protein [Nitrosomonas sp.]|uniref:hypothetical protein n=1 Tax=Nitrosomonas sp. TaxID=42353 RepID=UPI00283DB266|nr:hypothetical protein [Nitrosomonas sp.]MDR4513978.1 hypothetical protein [Nitrosomonas sp.]
MQYRVLSKFSISLFITLCLLSYAASSSAHGGGATMDAAGISRTFTAVVLVTCFDDGNGPAENLIARVRDNSPPESGLLVNLQLFKGNKAVSITDTVSGDADYSPYVTLHGGPGVYFMIINKTDAGARSVDAEWHCNTVDGIHTGTEISVSQFN